MTSYASTSTVPPTGNGTGSGGGGGGNSSSSASVTDVSQFSDQEFIEAFLHHLWTNVNLRDPLQLILAAQDHTKHYTLTVK